MSEAGKKRQDDISVLCQQYSTDRPFLTSLMNGGIPLEHLEAVLELREALTDRNPKVSNITYPIKPSTPRETEDHPNGEQLITTYLTVARLKNPDEIEDDLQTIGDLAKRISAHDINPHRMDSRPVKRRNGRSLGIVIGIYERARGDLEETQERVENYVEERNKERGRRTEARYGWVDTDDSDNY